MLMLHISNNFSFNSKMSYYFNHSYFANKYANVSPITSSLEAVLRKTQKNLIGDIGYKDAIEAQQIDAMIAIYIHPNAIKKMIIISLMSQLR